MKILMIRANPVRPDSRVEKEVSALYRHGYDVTVLGWDRSDDYSIRKEQLNDILPEVTAYRVGIKSSFGSGMKNLKYLLRFQKTIRQFLKKNKFDVVHACDFDTAFAAYHSVNRKNTKFVYDIFDYYADSFAIPSVLRRPVVALDRQIINGADIDIICTEQRRKQIAGSKPKKVIVIHNSPSRDLITINKFRSEPNDKIRIAYFGILSGSRLIKEMIEAVSENQQYELHIGGFGALEKFVEEASEKYENVVYYGKVSYQRVLEVEQTSDILTAIYDPAVRNHYYAAPNKFYEALMLGKPVIMAKNTGMSDIVESKHLGVTIDYSKEGFKKGLDDLSRVREEWSNIASRMIDLYNSEYSWEEMEKRLISAYRDLEKKKIND